MFYLDYKKCAQLGVAEPRRLSEKNSTFLGNVLGDVL